METTSSNDSIASKNYIAFFDLDQTITSSISGKALAKNIYRRGLMKPRVSINAVFLAILFRLKLKDPQEIIDKMVSWVRGIPEKTMADICSEVFREVIYPSVYKEAVNEIELHKTKNAKVVLLSSALNAIGQEIAKNLNIDDVICSELEIKNGYLTGFPKGHLCFGKEKAIRLLAYCEKDRTSPSDAWYYADSISDLPALNAVGNPVCVNPDKKLRKTASKRDWKIRNWNS